MQNENPVANSVRQIKIGCAKYKFAEQSRNFLMQLPMQLIFGDRWDRDKLQDSKDLSYKICAKGKSILEFRVKGNPKKCKQLKQSKNVQKLLWPSRPLESICLFD